MRMSEPDTLLNIYNASLLAYLQDLATDVGAHEERLTQLLVTALKKPLLKEINCFEPLTTLPTDAPKWLQDKFGTTPIHTFNLGLASPAIKQKVNHVKDWLHAALVQQQENPKADHLSWLQKTDQSGNPNKLVKLGTLEQAHHEANKAMLKNTMRLKQTTVTYDTIEADPHIEVVQKFEDGYCLVQITDKAGLKAEGALMGHCVGDGAYDAGLDSGAKQIYSLRDPQNKPHATLEVNIRNNTLIQCKGKQNQPAGEDYFRYLHLFIEQQQCELTEDIVDTGIVKHNDTYHSIFALPTGFIFKRYNDLSDIRTPIIFPPGVWANSWLIINSVSAHKNQQLGTLPVANDGLTAENKNTEDNLEDVILPDGTRVAAYQRWNDQGVLIQQSYRTNGKANDVLLHDGTRIAADRKWNDQGVLIQQSYRTDGKQNDVFLSDGTRIAAYQKWDDQGILMTQAHYADGKKQDILLSDGSIIPYKLTYNKNHNIASIRFADDRNVSPEQLEILNNRLQQQRNEVVAKGFSDNLHTGLCTKPAPIVLSKLPSAPLQSLQLN